METSNYVAFISEYLYWIIFIGVAIASWVVQAVFERRFERFSKVGLNMTGKEVAELMLRRNEHTKNTVIILRIYRVTITCRSLLYLLDSLFQYTFIQPLCQSLHKNALELFQGKPYI